MPDGTPFDMPADSPLPPPIDVPEGAAKQIAVAFDAGRRRRIRGRSTTARPKAPAATCSAPRCFIDSTSALRVEEEIDIAHPRLGFELRKTAKPGYSGLAIARIVEVRDKAIVFDEKFAPPVLTCAAHPVVEGWIDRVIGWIDNKLEELARYAADPTAGGGLQSADYFVLQLLNRHIPVLKHFRRSRYVHPERLYEELLRLVGELATFASPERRAHEYPAYDHDDLENIFEPVVRDMQDFLSARLGRRAIRLEIIERAPNAFVSTDPRPRPVPQRELRAGGRGAASADGNPEPVPASLQGRPEHEDERDRARASAGRAARPHADAAAADPRDHGSCLLPPRSQLRRSGRNSARPALSACTSPVTGQNCELEFWAVLEARR